MTSLPSKREFSERLRHELEQCDPALQQAASAWLIDPVTKTLKWEYGNCEEYPAWVFADLKERNVFAAYCLGGHGALGFPWGLIRMSDEHFGPDASWYNSLKALVLEWSMCQEP